jgi:NAD(P)H-dependent FMN reductase
LTKAGTEPGYAIPAHVAALAPRQRRLSASLAAHFYGAPRLKLLTFSASNSLESINRKLLDYVEQHLPTHEIEHLDINDYEMPIYSIDRENESGIPELTEAFLDRIGQADALIISFAEHNGNYTTAFKNILDWCSRADRDLYQNRKILMFSTSPGAGGGRNVMALARQGAEIFGGQVVASLSIPKFHDNFDIEAGKLVDEELDSAVKQAIETFTQSLA